MRAVQVATILLFPYPLQTFIAVIAVVAAQLPQQTLLYKRVYNIAATALSVGIGAVVYHWATDGGHDALLRPGHIAAAIPFVAIPLLLCPAVNGALLFGVIGLTVKRSPWREGIAHMRDALLPDLAIGAAGILAAILWRYDPVTLAFPLAITAILYSTLRSIRRTAMAEERAREALAQLAMDGLTGLPNGHALAARLEEEVRRVLRYHQSLSLLVVDLDDFRGINSAYGSHAGDTALRAVASTLRRNVRACDIVARYGDDEFAIILPETDLDGALVAAARLHRTLSDLEIVHDGAVFHVGGSIGAGLFWIHGESGAAELMRATTGAVHAAKAAGKGRVASADMSAAARANGVTHLSDFRRHDGR